MAQSNVILAGLAFDHAGMFGPAIRRSKQPDAEQPESRRNDYIIRIDKLLVKP
jgi:hypothetical protein